MADSSDERNVAGVTDELHRKALAAVQQLREEGSTRRPISTGPAMG